MKKIQITLILLITITAIPLFAHHAMEFIEMESYSTALKGEFVAHLHYDYMVDDKNYEQADHWEVTPGLSYGILDRLMFDIHTHFAKFNSGHLADSGDLAKYPNGPSPFIEAAAMSLQYRITEEKQLPINIAVSGFFEAPTPRARDLLDSAYVGGALLILGWDFGLHNNITANIKYERDGNENIIEWGLGIKIAMSLQDEHAPACGLELIGDFKGHMTLMPGFYISINQNTIFKTGIAMGLSQYIKDLKDDEDKEGDIRAHASIMRRW